MEENKEQISLSKFLVTIKTDEPIAIDLDTLRTTEANKEALRPIYENLEFRAFIKKLDDRPAEVQKSVSEWGALFDAQPDNRSDEPKEITHKTLNDVPHTYILVDNESDARQLC